MTGSALRTRNMHHVIWSVQDCDCLGRAQKPLQWLIMVRLIDWFISEVSNKLWNNFFTGLRLLINININVAGDEKRTHRVTAEALSHKWSSLVLELWYILMDPFLQFGFELADLGNISDWFRELVPLSWTTETVTVLGQSQFGVGDDNPVSSVVLIHDGSKIFRFMTLPYPVGAECWVVVH